ncbi:MAG: glycosyltransferase family 39 protein, partial [Candidatus Levybacteria bacterium]|nr:glycosyltransferase family 39 protein [Candidatus Levybacteria bacterium]
MRFLKQYLSHQKAIVILLTLVGAVLYFFNLNWGAPYYFHPDERNVASAVTQLQFPNQLNPNFFAYGSLPIYTVFFTGMLSNLLTGSAQINQLSFDQAILIGRVYSALFATILIPLLYVITRSVTTKESPAGVTVAFLAVTSVGFMQFAHFGTFEMWLTFFSVLLFWVSLRMVKKRNITTILLLGLVFGVLVATKISSLALLPIPLLAFLLSFRTKRDESKTLHTSKSKVKNVLFFFISLLLFSFFIGIFYILTNPFVILDTQSFLSSMRYESSVGLNTLPVFYTQGFYDTTPVLYQFTKIYPFLLNPLITFLLIPSFVYLLWLTCKTKSPQLFLLNSFFLILFLSQAVLFIKWTRYMVPTLPFIYLIIALALANVTAKKAKQSLVTLLILINSIFALSYFITAYAQPDTRITAANYAQARIHQDAPILSETYDLGITAFNPALPNITLFNTYDLDANSPDYNEVTWKEALESAEYIILPSQRVLQTRLQNAQRFPTGNTIYT